MLSRIAVAFTIYYPEPFDFHYPDETFHDNIADKVKLKVTPGEYESGTFVVFSPKPGKNVLLKANDLEGPKGSVIPKENIDVGVVTFMSREGNTAYQVNIWVGGMEAGAGLNAPYNGFNKDAKERLPVLPVCIVKDDAEFELAKADAESHITLTHRDNVKTFFKEGESKQFWVTVHIPGELVLPAFRNVFSGTLSLVVDEKTIEVPIEVEVINYRLDNLRNHGKYMGVMRAWDVGPEFRDAAMADIRACGCNALRAPIKTLEDYKYVKRYGFDFVISTKSNWTKEEVQTICEMGFLPLMYGRDEPGKPPPWKARRTILEHISLTNKIHKIGGLAGTSGSYSILKEISDNRGVAQDWWLMGISTRVWYSKRWLKFRKRCQYLADVRQDPSKKIVGLQGSYEGTMNGHYPLLTRIMYGFWLYNSNFDMGIHWGYAYRSEGMNPYTNTRAFMVAFPAVIKDERGIFLRREMIHSYTWDSFREGIDDFRYALTVNRMIDEVPNIEKRKTLRFEFKKVLDTFKEIDVRNEHKIRIDLYNGYAGTRRAREKLIDIMTAILSD
ncbi:MAG: hypothetical protein PVJ87_11065 [Desulfobacterales bacterium]